MKTFGKQTYRLLDNTKPYQRRKMNHAEFMTHENPKPSQQTQGRNRRWFRRLVSCRVMLTEAEIDHIIDTFGPYGTGKYHGKTDTWTYPLSIIGKLQRAKRKAANNERSEERRV